MEVRYNTTIGVRLTKEDACKVRVVAQKSRLTSSSFVRKVILDYVDNYFTEIERAAEEVDKAGVLHVSKNFS